jgi:hypothetical protein
MNTDRADKATLKLGMSREWLAKLTDLAARAGEPSKAAYLERLVGLDAAARGIEMPNRVPPSKFNPWLPPCERSATG